MVADTEGLDCHLDRTVGRYGRLHNRPGGQPYKCLYGRPEAVVRTGECMDDSAALDDKTTRRLGVGRHKLTLRISTITITNAYFISFS